MTMFGSDIEVTAKIASSLINYNKEDFLRNREFKFLEKCQRSMLVAIQTDQKLLHRRFQSLLQGTEIRHSEYNGDKTRARELKKKWSRGLNTSIGSTERNWDLEDVLRKHYGPNAAAHRQRAMGPNVEHHDFGIFCRCTHDKDENLAKLNRPRTASLEPNSAPIRSALSAPPIRKCTEIFSGKLGSQKCTHNIKSYESTIGYNSGRTLKSAPPLMGRMSINARTRSAHEILERGEQVTQSELQSSFSSTPATLTVNELDCQSDLQRSIEQFNNRGIRTYAFTEVADAGLLLSDTKWNEIKESSSRNQERKSSFSRESETFSGFSIELKPLCKRVSVTELKNRYMEHNAKFPASKSNIVLKIIPGSRPMEEVCSFDYYAERMRNDAPTRRREDLALLD